MHALAKAAVATTAAGAATLGWSALVERNWYAVRRVSLPVLPAGSRPFTILHISDLHLVPRQEHRIQWVRGLAALEPDLVVNTGDNSSDQHALPSVIRAMDPLLDRPGVFVLGSNDYFAPALKNPFGYFTQSHRRGDAMGVPSLPWKELTASFTGRGWIDLDNRRDEITVAGTRISLVGTDDAHLDYDEYPTGTSDSTADLRLGVTHAPYLRVLDKMAADGIDLALAGHTHGGQVCIPFHGALVTNCDLGTDRVRGTSRWWQGCDNAPSANAPAGAMWLNVSAGLGHNKFTPVRLACRPEAWLLTLLPRAANPAAASPKSAR